MEYFDVKLDMMKWYITRGNWFCTGNFWSEDIRDALDYETFQEALYSSLVEGTKVIYSNREFSIYEKHGDNQCTIHGGHFKHYRNTHSVYIRISMNDMKIYKDKIKSIKLVIFDKDDYRFASTEEEVDKIIEEDPKNLHYFLLCKGGNLVETDFLI